MHHVQRWFKNILCFAGAHFPSGKWSNLVPEGKLYFSKIRLRPNLGFHDFSKGKVWRPEAIFTVTTPLFFQHSLFCEVLIIEILDRIGDWLWFVDIQDAHLGEVDSWPRFDLGLCGSRWQVLAGAWVWSSAALGLRRYPSLQEVPGPEHFHKFRLSI